jgi:uncharacterized membrane protein YfcA
MTARIHALRRALVVCAALFALLLTFLSLQMLRGRDPSVRTAQVQTSAPASPAKDDGGSVLSSIVGFAASVIADGGDEHDGGGSSVRTQSS